MATVVIMPRQGQSVESCLIAKWHKKKGDSVSTGDILFTYETDKSTFDEESKADGTLLDIFFDEGDDVPCLTNVCVIGSTGESTAEFAPGGSSNALSETKQPEVKQLEDDKNKTELKENVKENLNKAIAESGILKISPRAKNLAEKTGADISYAVPTGANSRIMERDVEKVIAEGKMVTNAAKAGYTQGSGIRGTGIGGRVTTSDMVFETNDTITTQVYKEPEQAAEYEEVKLSGIRKLIAKSMHASLANTAQLTLNSSFDATDIFEFRKKLKDSAEALKLPSVSVTDIIVFVVSRVLLRHKNGNAHMLDDKMHLYNNVHMGIAADTPRGLMVPTLFNANKLSLAEISKAAKPLIESCRQGTINPDLLQGGTFTISNLGTMGVESFTPVLNPPQTCILGICSTIERTKNGKAYPAMGLSLTFDHRALDGADAARLLADIVANLENFSLMAVLNGGAN